MTFSLNLRSFQPLRGLCLFVLSSLCWEWWNSETFLLNLHKLWCRDCCRHPFLRKLCTPTNSHTYTHTHSLSPSPSLPACVMMKALSLHPYYRRRGQCKFTLTSLRLWQRQHSILREKKEQTYREREGEKERNDSSLWGAISIEAAPSPLPAIVGMNWRSQSTSWVWSVFACHLVRCGSAEEKWNESSTAHITGGSLDLSASVSRIPKGKKKHPQRKKDLSYAFIRDCILFVVTQTSESIDFQGTGYGEPYFSTLPFQVFVWRASIEILPVLHYFQHTWRASSVAVEHM